MTITISPILPAALSLQSDDEHAKTLALWLEGKPENTRRSYAAVVRDFLAYTGKHPRDMEALDVAKWKEYLKAGGLTDTSIAHRLSALSSLYSRLVKDGLLIRNPVDGVGRDDLEISPYGRARKITLEEFQAILAQIDHTTEMGARDYALFLFYFMCARRRSEVAYLYGRDFQAGIDRMLYRVRLKGGKTRWKELPPPVWQAIGRYLDMAGRKLEPNAPVFQATVESGDALREYYGVPLPDQPTPLTGEAVAQSLKRYASVAGIDPERITVHSLRHLGAEIFHTVSKDVSETQGLLDHAHLNTTQIYLSQITGIEHKHWREMWEQLGISP